jgi:hypothetical protein
MAARNYACPEFDSCAVGRGNDPEIGEAPKAELLLTPEQEAPDQKRPLCRCDDCPYLLARSEFVGPAVETILALHQGQRGLIHTVSYHRSILLRACCNASRLVFHSANNYDAAIKQFDSVSDAVFCSPRALEGLDLRYDRCRFIIFIKIPCPPDWQPTDQPTNGLFQVMVCP